MKLNPRIIFFDELYKIMKKDKDVIFLTGDLGYSYIEKIQKKFPKQVINCGCIEQSMVGIAVGLSLSGKKPYIYSTVPFLLFRALEQIRNDVVQEDNNVKLIGVSMTGFLGYTHNLLHPKEDMWLCENIGLDYFVPKTEKQIRRIINNTYKSNKASYVRL